MKHFPVQSAFTLIELLVAVSIMGILFTVGISRYNDFNRRQILTQATQELKSNLRLIQDKALAGEKNSICTTALEGWYISFTASSYQLGSRCNGADFSYKTVSLSPKNITISLLPLGTTSIRFKPLGHGPGGSTITITLTQTASGLTQAITVSPTGDIK